MIATARELEPLESALPPNIHPTLKEIAISIFLMLGEEEKFAAWGKKRLAELAIALTDRLSFDVGGANFYMPKGISFRCTARDLQIAAEWRGCGESG